jgi:hypothetical protein
MLDLDPCNSVLLNTEPYNSVLLDSRKFNSVLDYKQFYSVLLVF